jgi:hypothetical protein
MQRLRPIFIALAILALSATAVFAAAPAGAGLATGSHHPEPSQRAEPSEATGTAEASEGARSTGSAEASHPVNHGCVVSAAAKTAVPSGYKNRGQWVSSIAKNKSAGSTSCALPTGGPAASPTANPT